jgi:hypothetical protein
VQLNRDKAKTCEAEAAALQRKANDANEKHLKLKREQHEAEKALSKTEVRTFYRVTMFHA